MVTPNPFSEVQESKSQEEDTMLGRISFIKSKIEKQEPG